MPLPPYHFQAFPELESPIQEAFRTALGAGAVSLTTGAVGNFFAKKTERRAYDDWYRRQQDLTGFKIDETRKLNDLQIETAIKTGTLRPATTQMELEAARRAGLEPMQWERPGGGIENYYPADALMQAVQAQQPASGEVSQFLNTVAQWTGTSPMTNAALQQSAEAQTRLGRVPTLPSANPMRAGAPLDYLTQQEADQALKAAGILAPFYGARMDLAAAGRRAAASANEITTYLPELPKYEPDPNRTLYVREGEGSRPATTEEARIYTQRDALNAQLSAIIRSPSADARYPGAASNASQQLQRLYAPNPDDPDGPPVMRDFFYVTPVPRAYFDDVMGVDAPGSTPRIEEFLNYGRDMYEYGILDREDKDPENPRSWAAQARAAAARGQNPYTVRPDQMNISQQRQSIPNVVANNKERLAAFMIAQHELGQQDHVPSVEQALLAAQAANISVSPTTRQYIERIFGSAKAQQQVVLAEERLGQKTVTPSGGGGGGVDSLRVTPPGTVTPSGGLPLVPTTRDSVSYQGGVGTDISGLTAEFGTHIRTLLKSNDLESIEALREMMASFRTDGEAAKRFFGSLKSTQGMVGRLDNAAFRSSLFLALMRQLDAEIDSYNTKQDEERAAELARQQQRAGDPVRNIK